MTCNCGAFNKPWQHIYAVPFKPFSLVSITPYTASKAAKYENVAAYHGLDCCKRYAAIVAGGSDSTVSIWDVTSPELPVFKSKIVLSGSYNIVIECIGGHIYAFIPASGGQTLTILNLDDPSSMKIVSSTKVTNAAPYAIYSVAYANGYCYLATQSVGLTVLDVGGGLSGGTLTHPVQTYQEGGTINKTGGVDVSPDGKYVYTTNYSTTFPATVRYLKTWSLFGAGSRSVPSLSNTYSVPGGPVSTSCKPLGVKISPNGITAYVTDGNQGKIDIVDVTIPTIPKYLTYITPTASLVDNTLQTVAFKCDNSQYVYIPSGSSATLGGVIDLYNVIMPSNPIHLSSVSTGIPHDVFGMISISDGYIYAADYGAPGGYSTIDVFTAGAQ